VTGTDDLTGRVVVVTGASKGVGLGIARHLAARGARLAVSARGAEGLARTSAELDRSPVPQRPNGAATASR
jgi:NAD(P)-dependent dehydrogenase (short-subunit alcohol dehydrogenase family)